MDTSLCCVEGLPLQSRVFPCEAAGELEGVWVSEERGGVAEFMGEEHRGDGKPGRG